LESINSSKNEALTEAEKAQSFLTGTKLIETAFKANNRSAAAANALCELFLRKSDHSRVRAFLSLFLGPSLIVFLYQALKLAERTIQFADTKTILTEGYLRAGRVSHAGGSLAQATKFYFDAVKGQPKHVVGAIGMAQSQMLNGLY